MATQWLRRTWLLAAASALAALAGCGGGDIVSSFTPTRIVVFGDAMADLGQGGKNRYTVNDGSINNWTLTVASGFGVPLAADDDGGTSFATGNARVTATPDAAGVATTPTITGQIDAFLGGSGVTSGDLVIVNGGTSDVIVQAREAIAGRQTEDQAVANAGQAGRELAAQVRRLVSAGAQHVVVVGPYNLGRSVWAVEENQASLLEAVSSKFNEQLLVSMVDLGENVLYVDAALEFNLLTADLSGSQLSEASSEACTSVDPTLGIGIAENQVNSRNCTAPQDIAAGVDYTTALFADRVYPTPRGHQLFGDFAFTRIRDRW